MYCETQSRTKNIAQFVPGVRFLARQRDSYTPFLRRVNCAFTIAPPPVFPYLRTRISTPKTILCPMSFKTFVILSLCPKKNCASYHLRVVTHSIHISFVEIRGGLSYHLRHRFHTTFVLSKFSNHLSINQLQNFPTFPTFPIFPTFHIFHVFPPFPPFPAFPAFPPFLAIPKNSWFIQ